MRKIYFLLLITPIFSLGQQKSELVLGVNGGGYFANKNTALIYSGNYTNYNVFSIFSNSINKPTFDQFFQYPYSIYDIPNDIKYSIGTEIGFHIGKQKRKTKYYIDFNFADINVQDFITVAIENQSVTQSLEPEYFPVSINGKEKRNMINLGIIKTIYEESNLSILTPIFLQLLEMRLKENYIVVNNQQYNIIHNSSIQNNQSQVNSPGGYGLGFGSGLIFNYFINKDLSIDFGYHIQYSKTNFSEQLNEWGVQQSLFARVIVNGSKYLSNLNN